MALHKAKTCPRCNEPFSCKVGNITQCQCFGISFTDAEKEYIAGQYNECLCRNCLDLMKHEARLRKAQSKIQSILSILKPK